MKTTDFLNENFVEDAAAAHQDHEVQMARADCYNAAKYAIELHKLLKNISEQQGLDGWVSEKITLANDYLRTVTEYLRYEQQTGSHSSDMPEFDIGSATQTLDSVLGESVMPAMQEGTFTWYLKAHGRLLSPSTSDIPYKFSSKEEALAFAKKKFTTNWQNIVATADTTANYLEKQPDAGWDEKRLNVREEDDEEKSKRKPAVVKTNKEIGTRVADIGPGGKEYNVKTNKAWDDQHKQDVEEGKADPVGSWVVYNGSKLKRFKSREGAKAYAEKNGGKVASSEHYADNIQGKQGVAEGAEERKENRLRTMITDYEQRAKATKNDIKRDHLMKMAKQLRDKLKTTDEQGVAEGSTWYAGNGAIKEKIAKYEELALAANRAGDDTKTKMYQQKIQTLKQKMSHMEESAGGMGAASVATSMGGGNGFVNGGPGTISRPKMKKKK